MANNNYLKIQNNLRLGKNIAFDLDVTADDLAGLFPVPNQADALDRFYKHAIEIIKKISCTFILNPSRFMHYVGAPMALDYLIQRAVGEKEIPLIIEMDGIKDERIAENLIVGHYFNRNHVAGVIIPATTPANVFAVIAREKGRLVIINSMVETVTEADPHMKPIFHLNPLAGYCVSLGYIEDTDAILGVEINSSLAHLQCVKDHFELIERKHLIISRQENPRTDIFRIPLSSFFPDKKDFLSGVNISEDDVAERFCEKFTSYLRYGQHSASLAT